MDNAKLYSQSNSLQRKDAIDVLDSYMHMVRWKKGDSLIDVGCGDGDITVNVLLKKLPSEYSRVLGVDISPEMIKHARANYEDDKINFQQMDICSPFEDKIGVFDHVFSFNCLNWIQDQKNVMEKMYLLMKEGGDMVVNLIAKNHIFDIYKIMSQDPCWKNYMTDYKKYISPYNDVLNPAADMKKILNDIGFKNIRVEHKHKMHYFHGLKILRDSVVAVNPFLKNIPTTLHQEFLDDYVRLVKELGFIEEDNNNVGEKVKIKTLYSVLMIYATKN